MVATTTRVGVDIVGTDRTRPAFASATAGLASLNRSLNVFKGAMAGIVGGNLLASFIRSMVGINREVPGVKQAVDGMKASWQAFGLEVGRQGLNQALIDFANNLSAATAQSNGLAQGVAFILSSGIRILGSLIAGVATVASEMATIFDGGREAALNLGIALGDNGLVRTFSFLTAEINRFWEDTRRAIDQLGRFASAAAAIDFSSFDALKSSVADLMAVISADSPGLQKGSLPAQIDGFGKIIQRNVPIINLGTAAVEKHVASVVRVPPVVAQASQSLYDMEVPVRNVASATEDFSKSFASEFTSAFMSVIDGSKSAKEAFADMAKSILSSATSMFASRFFSALFGGGGNGGGGIFSSLFGGFRAAGGPVSSGRAYVVGEKGPEMFVPGQSGAIIPNGGVTGPAINMSITINAPNSDKLALAALGAKVEKMAAGLQRTVRQTVQTEYNRNPRFVS